MGIAHLLEEFSGYESSAEISHALSDVAFEEQRLDAFEQGYKAGWDDAIKAQSDDQSRISGDFARNLQDLSFTYHEAIGHLTKSMTPLFSQIVDKFLPKMACATLGARIVEQLSEMAQNQTEQPIEIVVSPHNASAVRSLAEQEISLPVVIIEEPTLGEGQVYLRFGNSEREINLDQVQSKISEAIDAFFHQTQEDLKHG